MLIDGQWRHANPCDDPDLSRHRDGKITDAELDLINEYWGAFEYLRARHRLQSLLAVLLEGSKEDGGGDFTID